MYSLGSSTSPSYADDKGPCMCHDYKYEASETCCCAMMMKEGLPTCEVVVATLCTSRGQALIVAAAGDHLTILQSTCHTGLGEKQCKTAVTTSAEPNTRFTRHSSARQRVIEHSAARHRNSNARQLRSLGIQSRQCNSPHPAWIEHSPAGNKAHPGPGSCCPHTEVRSCHNPVGQDVHDSAHHTQTIGQQTLPPQQTAAPLPGPAS